MYVKIKTVQPILLKSSVVHINTLVPIPCRVVPTNMSEVDPSYQQNHCNVTSSVGYLSVRTRFLFGFCSKQCHNWFVLLSGPQFATIRFIGGRNQLSQLFHNIRWSRLRAYSILICPVLITFWVQKWSICGFLHSTYYRKCFIYNQG